MGFGGAGMSRTFIKVVSVEYTPSSLQALPLGYRPIWQGKNESNIRIRESKSLALPLGDSPKIHGFN